MDEKVSYEKQVEGWRIGKAPARSHPKMLSAGDYITATSPAPIKYDFWKGRAPFKLFDTGNSEYGCCTIASQALLQQRSERIETKQSIVIPRENILKAYFDMTKRLYNGGDTGAYELDALNNWRNPEFTIKDSKGHPMTIDAYTKINHTDIEAVKNALVLSGSHGIKVCFNMPIAWASRQDMVWDIPEGQAPIGQYLPGSWGGHSMMATAKYDAEWVYLPSSWNLPDGKISWRAFAIYCDEAYMIVDSVDAWRKRLGETNIDVNLNINQLVADVNAVSSQKIVV